MLNLFYSSIFFDWASHLLKKNLNRQDYNDDKEEKAFSLYEKIAIVEEANPLLNKKGIFSADK